jgi:methyl-accepting chemotaxis protein
MISIESNDVNVLATVAQALAALVTVAVTIALLRVTTRYADSTEKMVRALAQERADRIEERRLPVRNLLRRILQRLGELTIDRYLETRGDEYEDVRARFNTLYEAIRTTCDEVRRVSFSYSDNLTSIARQMYDFTYVLNGVDEAPDDAVVRARFETAVNDMRADTVLAIDQLDRLY